MFTIYLVRHGQKLPHAGDPRLSQLGKQQALETGRYLQQFKIDLILASPYKRTVETAQIISKELNQDFQITPALTERMNWDKGDMTQNDFFRNGTERRWTEITDPEVVILPDQLEAEFKS